MALLLPLRSVWAVDLVLLGLAFTVPGVLALRVIRVPAATITRYPLYVPAASLFVMLAAGLACDLLGPLVGVSRPLSGEATAITTIGLCVVMWLAAVRAPKETYLSWSPLLGRPALLIPLALPLASAAGALLLNGGHGDTVARVVAVLTVAVLMFGLFRAPRLSRGQVAMILFACSLSAEWAFSLRSQEVIGFDIATEIEIAQHTHGAGIWHAYQPGNAYAAMLSLTVLPSLLAALTGCVPLVAFKAVYPIITALLPVSIFFVADRFVGRRFAACAASVLLVQDYFFQGLPGIARQEIGMLFFAALVAALLDDQLRRSTQLRLIVGLCLGMVVTHYSTTYVTITVLAIAIVAHVVLIRMPKIGRPPLAWLVALVALAGGALLWNNAITQSASELNNFVNSLQRNGLQLLPNSGGGVINSYLKGNQGRAVTPGAFERAAVQDDRTSHTYIHPLPASVQSRYSLRSSAVPYPPSRSSAVNSALSTGYTVFSELILLAAGVGTLLMLFLSGGSPVIRRLAILCVGTIGFLTFIRFSGTAASFYNETRALMQALVILALPMGWLVQRAIARLPRGHGVSSLLPALALGVVLVDQTGAIAVVNGGGTSLNLSQGGEDFERQYMTPADLAGANWVEAAGARQIIQSDRYGQLRIAATDGLRVLTNLTPKTVDQHAWVYGDRTNIVLGRARGQVNDVSATYGWPSAFLDDQFDTVYDNGDSKVYHR
jgi:hypothetical protein